MVVITLDDQIVSRSRNLRGIMEYARVNPVILMHIVKESDGSGILSIIFYNGAEVNTKFADYNVLKQWAANRLTYNANFHGADFSWQ